MSFKKNKYKIIKKTISNELTNFIFDFFLLKRKAIKFMYDNNVQETSILGTWKDVQVPGTYSHYSDFVMETLLLKLLPVIEKNTSLKLIPNYSYARIYKKGDILHPHKDRFSCEISTTLNLGGDLWPIYLKLSDKKKIKVNLKPGDMLVYSGCELEHWREKFKGEDCAQVFLHYNNIKTKGAKENIYDGRPYLGLPVIFKKIF